VDEESVWIDAFVTAMTKLGASAPPHILADMAMAYFMTHGSSDPVQVARWRVEHFGLPGKADD
jgi:hypothetical protein